MKYKVEFPADEGLIARDQAGTKSLAKPTKSFTVPLNAAGSGSDVVKLGFNYFYCQEGNEGVCKIGSVTFQVPVTLSDEGTTHQVKLVRVAEE